MAMAHLLAAVVFVIAATLSLSSAEAQVRKPSLALSAPGVLVIYTAKGGEEPDCQSSVEYRTPPGSGTKDGTVHVRYDNRSPKDRKGGRLVEGGIPTYYSKSGDHYKFTSTDKGGDLTTGFSYDFRVQHTSGTNDACQPHNTWSGWSDAYTLKAPRTIRYPNVVTVTPKTASGHGDTSGTKTDVVARGKWVGLHFDTGNDAPFRFDTNIEICAKKNSADALPFCNNALGIGTKLLLNKGEKERWRYFRVASNRFNNGDTIHLRLRSLTFHNNPRKNWSWEEAEQCLIDTASIRGADKNSYVPCKRLTLTVAEQQETETETEQETEIQETKTEQETETEQETKTEQETETEQEQEQETESPDDGKDNNDYSVQDDSTTQGGNEGDGGSDDESESDNDEQDAEPSPDLAALVAIYNAAGGDGWEMNWDITAASIDGWHGVMTDEEGRVVELDLSENNLSETVAEEMADLEKLEKLDLSDNPDLTGELPPGLMGLANLTKLDISGTDVCPPPDNEEFRTWLGDLAAFSGNDSCKPEQTEEPTDGEVEESGGGGCAIASGEQKGSFQVFLAVFALATAVLCAGRFGVFRRG